jgi:hypothetical protein
MLSADNPIEMLSCGRYNVDCAVAELDAHPEVWDAYKSRTPTGGPHVHVSDVWVRFRKWADLKEPKNFGEPHESVWYPEADKLPGVRALVEQVYEDVGGKVLGGVLVTKIPAGKEVLPHVDNGWHARRYEKFAVQLKGHTAQRFCFKNAELATIPGDLYTFDNSYAHWVTNPTDEERMTLIICIRKEV